jgi:hypothetical protein
LNRKKPEANNAPNDPTIPAFAILRWSLRLKAMVDATLVSFRGFSLTLPVLLISQFLIMTISLRLGAYRFAWQDGFCQK